MEEITLPSAKKEFLQTVEKIVDGDRQLNYGAPEDNFKRIAVFWTDFLGIPVTARDVAAMMVLMKVARIMNTPDHKDSWIDIAGYAACGGTIEKQ